MPSPTILFAAKSEKWAEYEPALRKALQKTGVDATGLTTEADPAEVDYIIYAPNSGLQDFTPFTRAKAVLSLWAGVEDIVGNKTITMPLARARSRARSNLLPPASQPNARSSAASSPRLWAT